MNMCTRTSVTVRSCLRRAFQRAAPRQLLLRYHKSCRPGKRFATLAVKQSSIGKTMPAPLLKSQRTGYTRDRKVRRLTLRQVHVSGRTTKRLSRYL
jgi:hypothetical protein